MVKSVDTQQEPDIDLFKELSEITTPKNYKDQKASDVFFELSNQGNFSGFEKQVGWIASRHLNWQEIISWDRTRTLFNPNSQDLSDYLIKRHRVVLLDLFSQCWWPIMWDDLSTLISEDSPVARYYERLTDNSQKIAVIKKLGSIISLFRQKRTAWKKEYAIKNAKYAVMKEFIDDILSVIDLKLASNPNNPNNANLERNKRNLENLKRKMDHKYPGINQFDMPEELNNISTYVENKFLGFLKWQSRWHSVGWACADVWMSTAAAVWFLVAEEGLMNNGESVMDAWVEFWEIVWDTLTNIMALIPDDYKTIDLSVFAWLLDQLPDMPELPWASSYYIIGLFAILWVFGEVFRNNSLFTEAKEKWIKAVLKKHWKKIAMIWTLVAILHFWNRFDLGDKSMELLGQGVELWKDLTNSLKQIIRI